MATNFFENQGRARRNTGRLVILFILAVIAIMVMVYLVIALFLASQGGDGAELLSNPMLMVGVAGGTLLVVGGASLYKIAELSGGGETIALSLGGSRLEPGTVDTNERKIMNVVEEMAIASGTPVPPVYVMERERGINAFAAGYSPGDAVIGVSRGSVEILSRDELQGVVAHEFSHIMNGDMRLNIRLIGILHGILVIGLIGHMIMRTAFYSGSSYRRSSRDKGGGAGAIMLLGLGLMIIGFVGTFFGKWIKAAVSRQREYLADASAVQFTRNPEGIAGALKKIGGLSEGSRLEHPRAEEMSHMFFSQALSESFIGLFNTHPPLRERIKRIDPAWDGTYPDVVAPARETPSLATAGGGRISPRERLMRGAVRTPQGLVLTSGALAAAVESVGRPTQAHIDYARELVSEIPEALREAAREPYAARAVVSALLLNREEEPRRRQYALLAEQGHGGLFELVRRLESPMLLLEERSGLPLLEMCIPALREMAREQYQSFRSIIDGLIAADERVEIFEWALRRIVAHHLDSHFGLAERPRAQLRSDPEQLQRALAMLLSNLAYAGHRDRESVARAFTAGARVVELSGDHVLPFEQVNLRGLDEAVELLAHAAPPLKRRVLAACAACIEADREVTVREADLLRAIAEVFDAPMPPVLQGQVS